MSERPQQATQPPGPTALPSPINGHDRPADLQSHVDQRPCGLVHIGDQVGKVAIGPRRYVIKASGDETKQSLTLYVSGQLRQRLRNGMATDFWRLEIEILDRITPPGQLHFTDQAFRGRLGDTGDFMVEGVKREQPLPDVLRSKKRR